MKQYNLIFKVLLILAFFTGSIVFVGAQELTKKEIFKMKSPEWEVQKNQIKTVDLVGKTQRVIIAEGANSKTDLKKQNYHAHPTTVMTNEGEIYCVWNIGHGGNAKPLAKTIDGGKTWQRIDEIMPACYQLFKNCPSIYKITDKQGKERLFVFAQKTHVLWGIPDGEENYKGYMPRVMSEDGGKTWQKLSPLGEMSIKSPFECVMTFSSMVQLKDGSTLGVFHRGRNGKDSRILSVLQSKTDDGGLTWSTPTVICNGDDIGKLAPCEPYIFRSPDGNELCCIMRENTRKNGTSLVMFSKDEGKTWSKPIDTPWALSGDRHQGIYLPDGRLFIVFRNQVPNDKRSPLHFAGWIGTYNDIKNGKPGQYRVLLSKSLNGDGYYQGIHQLKDGTIAITTYESVKKAHHCSVVCHRIKLTDIEKQ